SHQKGLLILLMSRRLLQSPGRGHSSGGQNKRDLEELGGDRQNILELPVIVVVWKQTVCCQIR
ncbi:UNVERIFIED_CONTAM: hypothetical protein K2H54_065451, partial [Gekko kuhli]